MVKHHHKGTMSRDMAPDAINSIARPPPHTSIHRVNAVAFILECQLLAIAI